MERVGIRGPNSALRLRDQLEGSISPAEKSHLHAQIDDAAAHLKEAIRLQPRELLLYTYAADLELSVYSPNGLAKVQRPIAHMVKTLTSEGQIAAATAEFALHEATKYYKQLVRLHEKYFRNQNTPELELLYSHLLGVDPTNQDAIDYARSMHNRAGKI